MPKNFPDLPKFSDPFFLMSPNPKDIPVYTLVTSGGKEGHPEKATVTVTMKYPIVNTESEKLGKVTVGYITLRQEMHCTLGKSPALDSVKMHYDFEGPGVGGVSQKFIDKLGGKLPGFFRKA